MRSVVWKICLVIVCVQLFGISQRLTPDCHRHIVGGDEAQNAAAKVISFVDRCCGSLADLNICGRLREHCCKIYLDMQ